MKLWLNLFFQSLPWNRNERKITYLEHEVRGIKEALIEAQLVHFIMVRDYVPGEILYDMPVTISLADLLERVEKLEDSKK